LLLKTGLDLFPVDKKRLYRILHNLSILLIDFFKEKTTFKPMQNLFKWFKKKIKRNYSYVFDFIKPLNNAQKRGFLVSYQAFFGKEHDRFYEHIDRAELLVLKEDRLETKKLQAFFHLWKTIGLQSIQEKKD